MRSKSTARWIALAVISTVFGAGALAGPSALAQHSSATTRPSVSVPEVLGFGHQSPADPSAKDVFGVFAVGSGSSATGTASVYVGSPAKFTNGNVTCVQTSGNDSIVTVKVKIGGVKQIEVLEVVDNSSPSDSGNPDLVRFSFDPFITPTNDPKCWLPQLPPEAIRSGDVRVNS